VCRSDNRLDETERLKYISETYSVRVGVIINVNVEVAGQDDITAV
jgi:hypothetical protein